MKRSWFVVLPLFGAGFALAVTGVAAPPSPTPPAASAPAASEPPTVQSLGTLADGNFRWGHHRSEVVEIYNRAGGIFDQEYAPILSRMQPGSNMEGVVADRGVRKRGLASSYVQFIDASTGGAGWDGTAIKNEYTYLNKESMAWVTRVGTKRFFFFFGDPPNDRLWKIYEEVSLKPDGPLGATFQEATAKLEKMLGAPGRVRLPANGGERTTAEWQDGLTHLRVVDRSSEHVLALVFAERATLARLESLRPNKPVDQFTIDPSIANAMRPPPPPPAASGSAPRR